MTGTSAPAGLSGLETRAAILSAALDLFCEQGYDKASLREVAERVGVSKAALYYHFKSKSDILLALTSEAVGDFERMVEGLRMPFDAEGWEAALMDLLDRLLAQPRLSAMIQRNPAAFEQVFVARESTVYAELGRVVDDTALPLGVRVRILASVTAVMNLAGAVSGYGLFRRDDAGELRREARDAVRRLLA